MVQILISCFYLNESLPKVNTIGQNLSHSVLNERSILKSLKKEPELDFIEGAVCFLLKPE